MLFKHGLIWSLTMVATNTAQRVVWREDKIGTKTNIWTICIAALCKFIDSLFAKYSCTFFLSTFFPLTWLISLSHYICILHTLCSVALMCSCLPSIRAPSQSLLDLLAFSTMTQIIIMQTSLTRKVDVRAIHEPRQSTVFFVCIVFSSSTLKMYWIDAPWEWVKTRQHGMRMCEHGMNAAVWDCVWSDENVSKYVNIGWKHHHRPARCIDAGLSRLVLIFSAYWIFRIRPLDRLVPVMSLSADIGWAPGTITFFDKNKTSWTLRFNDFTSG